MWNISEISGVEKEEAVHQILDRKYYTGLSGEVLCVGVAHDKKRCSAAYKTITV